MRAVGSRTVRWVRSVPRFVRIRGPAGFVRIFAPSGPVGALDSFGFRRCSGSVAPPTGRSRLVRSARRVRVDSRRCRVRSDLRAVGSAGSAGFVRRSPLLGSVRSADLPVSLGSFGPSDSSGFQAPRGSFGHSRGRVR
jgi:hypothetical protein